MKTLFLALALALPLGCAAFQGSAAAKLDQIAGIWLQYDSTPKADADKAAAFEAAIGVLGADFAQLEAVVPSATGLALAQKLVDGHPELTPYADLLAKLYTLALYGPTPATETLK